MKMSCNISQLPRSPCYGYLSSLRSKLFNYVPVLRVFASLRSITVHAIVLSRSVIESALAGYAGPAFARMLDH